MNPAVLIFLHESSIMCHRELLNCYQTQLRNINAWFLLFTHNGGVWIIAGHSSEGYNVKSIYEKS